MEPAKPEVAVVPPPPVAPVVLEPFPALAKIKKDYIERYQNEVKNKTQVQEKDYGDKYKSALAKLEPEFLSRNDASGVIQVRAELERFAAANTPPATSELARSEKVAELQKKFIAGVAAVRKLAAPQIMKINADFSEGLSRLANTLAGEGKKEEMQAVKTFREAGMKAPDYVGAVGGFVEMPASAIIRGEIVDGNVAQAKMGAIAKAENNPDGLIDGLDDKDNAAWSDVDGSLSVTFNKVYHIEQIAFHLPRSEENAFQYVLEGTVDLKTWKPLGKKVEDDRRGYQFIDIPPQPLKAFRILPKKVSGEKHFLVEEAAAFCEGKKPETWGTPKPPK